MKNGITFNVFWSIKTCHYYFMNSSVKHWPISVIFGQTTTSAFHKVV